MKILVTGASGNVGKTVVEALLNVNETVVAAGIDLDSIQRIFGQRVEKVYFDFTDPTTFEKALEGVDRVFLMRPPHLGNPQDLYPFIDAMKKNPIILVSFLSLMGVENNPIPPHHKIEKYIEKVGLTFAHIRPGFFMQNISGVHAEEIRTLDQIYVPAGKSKTSFIDAADIGLAVAEILHDPVKHANSSHTITGPQALDYYQIAEILTEVTQRTIKYANIGFLKYRKHYLVNRKLDQKYVDVTIALYFMTRMGTAKKVTDGFFELTGKQPKSFRQFAVENKEAFE